MFFCMIGSLTDRKVSIMFSVSVAQVKYKYTVLLLCILNEVSNLSFTNLAELSKICGPPYDGQHTVNGVLAIFV